MRFAPTLALLLVAVMMSLGAKSVAAAPLERDLGSGLVYLRMRELPDDLLAKPTGRVQPCVVDLRYVQANSDAAKAFHEWVKARATSRTPVFVLANSETSPDLTRPLNAKPRGSAVVVVGIPAGRFRPHVAVSGTAENERRAYNALGSGTPLAALLTDNPNKVRNDEASLSRDRLAEAAADGSDDAGAGKATAPPVDATLQRAVHLHRALVALRKI